MVERQSQLDRNIRGKDFEQALADLRLIHIGRGVCIAGLAGVSLYAAFSGTLRDTVGTLLFTVPLLLGVRRKGSYERELEAQLNRQ